MRAATDSITLLDWTGNLWTGLQLTLLATVLVGEPITPNLIAGLIAVFSGIWIATTVASPGREPGR